MQGQKVTDQDRGVITGTKIQKKPRSNKREHDSGKKPEVEQETQGRTTKQRRRRQKEGKGLSEKNSPA